MGQDLNKIESMYNTIAKEWWKHSPVNTKRNRKTKKFSIDSRKRLGREVRSGISAAVPLIQ